MTKVKICGITNLIDLDVVTESGVDALGVITGIPSSPRSVSPNMAKKIIDRAPIFTKSVLVIAPANIEEAIEVCDYVKPDAVQIHGENIDVTEFSKYISDIDIIKPVSINQQNIKDSALKAAEFFDAVLLDSSTSSNLGGTGKVHDWDISRQIAEVVKPKPMILAGGLNPDNVSEAIRRVRPYAVDVCTGTEARPGVKDPEKVGRFLSMVDKADRRYRVE